MKITVLGAGTWGWSIARLLRQNGHELTLWATTQEKAMKLETSRQNPKLKDALMPEGVTYTSDLQKACTDAEIIIFATASSYIRATAERIRPFLNPDQILVTAAKGIERNSLRTMSQVVEDAVSGIGCYVAAISGPTHAEEVSGDMPTAMVCASEDLWIAEKISGIFSSAVMRTYPSTDVTGVELCGALKNIIALAAGVGKGLGYGDNALAALITRGMAEIKRLGLAMGCEAETFDGLAGIGDLMVTCFSSHSRNMNAGLLIGGGMTPEAAIEKIGMVVEGVFALDAATELAKKYGISMPITNAVYNVIHNGAEPRAAAEYLMVRDRF